MTSASRVTVIIPTYNRSDLLRHTVDSVLGQTYPDIELIVVDDGSTDDTAIVMASYGDRVTYIYQENQGPDAAMAHGFMLAQGQYINFIDHDDIMYPDKIAQQVAVLDTQPRVDLVHCQYDLIDEHGQIIRKATVLPDQKILHNLVIADFIWAGAPLIRRECLEKVGLFDEDLWCSDRDLWIRIALDGYGITCIQYPLGAYRIVTNSVVTNVRAMEESAFLILDRLMVDPRVPPDIRAMRDFLYSRTSFEMFARYVAAGQWDAANRSLQAYLELKPDVLDNPEQLWPALWDELIQNPRVADPVKVFECIFEHLPPMAAALRQCRAEWTSNAYIVKAFRAFQQRNVGIAQQHIEYAIALNPKILQKAQTFIQILAVYALTLPVSDPFRYVDFVYDNLPGLAQKMRSTRGRVVGAINIMLAFQKYYMGKHHKVIPYVLGGVWNRPEVLRNKGVSSIFIKSLFSYLYDQNALR